MPEPLVVQAMRAFKAQLLKSEAQQMQQMAQRWLGVEMALSSQIDALAAEVAALQAAGKTVNKRLVYKLDRTKRLLVQATAEFNKYAAYADGTISQHQDIFGTLGKRNATEAIQLSYLPTIDVEFARLPIEAVQNMVGIAGNGMPLGELLKLRMVVDANGQPLPGVWDKLIQTLVDSTAMGKNPRETALAMMDALTGGLNKALVIARTEQLRVYRQASADQYRISGVVTGQKRLTAHDARVCPACIADEGTIYPVGVAMPDHPQGRCTGVPVLKTLPPIKWLSGEKWFNQQPESTQRAILGPGRLDAWKSGAFAFKDLVIHTHSKEWGGGLATRPLSELQ